MSVTASRDDGWNGEWKDMVLVGRIARPHGLRGHVVVNPETDFVDERFAPGQRVFVKTGEGLRALTVETFRLQGTRPVLTFTGIGRVEEAEPLAGHELRVPEAELTVLEAGRFYEYQLVGCQVEAADGAVLGAVKRIDGGFGASRLVVDVGGDEVLIPFVTEMCPEIDVAARRIRVVLPEGLLDLNVRQSRRRAGPERR